MYFSVEITEQRLYCTTVEGRTGVGNFICGIGIKYGAILQGNLGAGEGSLWSASWGT